MRISIGLREVWRMMMVSVLVGEGGLEPDAVERVYCKIGGVKFF